MRDTGEQLREQGIFLSWIPVLRTDPPQILEGYEIYHRLARHNIEWCGVLANPPFAFHPGPSPVTYGDEDPPNDPDPEPPDRIGTSASGTPGLTLAPVGPCSTRGGTVTAAGGCWR